MEKVPGYLKITLIFTKYFKFLNNTSRLSSYERFCKKKQTELPIITLIFLKFKISIYNLHVFNLMKNSLVISKLQLG